MNTNRFIWKTWAGAWRRVVFGGGITPDLTTPGVTPDLTAPTKIASPYFEAPQNYRKMFFFNANYPFSFT